MTNAVNIKMKCQSSNPGKTDSPPVLRGAYRNFICYQIEQFVEPWARKFVMPAMAGDVDAALSLSVAVGNKRRGQVVVAFWRAKVPRESFRALLSSVWDHDHNELITAARTRRLLRALFRYAQFDTSILPGTVQVWRGTSGCDPWSAANGQAWTTDRDVACWFAMRFAEFRGNPLVLTSTVRREDIYLFNNERNESEVVLFDIQYPRIDGDVNDWKERAANRCAKVRARHSEYLSETDDEPMELA
ncbi:hypothetical protein [Duganella qianjiadongensis]|uniref:Uncharacterized protein n=1 Tax=Duganella qianjiadongensis TaxID=2692176 RepID=A0ABW9VRN0_9BURK|nr:hypothetical protein [Duganella qianjiadongensis]MYM41941.1 hypothetical protein [Duganella qianjiadongensis]